MYTVLGLSDDGHVELHDTDGVNAASDWIKEYIRWGDWGGYYGFAIVDPDGDWVTVHNAPEDGD